MLRHKKNNLIKIVKEEIVNLIFFLKTEIMFNKINIRRIKISVYIEKLIFSNKQFLTLLMEWKFKLNKKNCINIMVINAMLKNMYTSTKFFSYLFIIKKSNNSHQGYTFENIILRNCLISVPYWTDHYSKNQLYKSDM